MKTFLVAIAVCLSVICICYAKQQCLTVRGRATCAAKTPIYIKLVDEDGTSGDDLMDETFAGKMSGAFQVRGCASDPIGDIDPEVHLFHNCKGEQRRVKFIVPATAINKEYNFTQILDMDRQWEHDEKKKYTLPKCPAKKPKFYYF